MSRFVVLSLLVSLGNTSVAYAGETLRSAVSRVAREAAQSQASYGPKSAAVTAAQRHWTVPSVAATILPGQPGSSALMQEQPGLSSSGLRKRTKVLIFLAAAVGIAAAAYTIDHKVEDNTPSSLGLRED